jgi:tetratricopeptide (TPR) repeat protein
MVYMEQGEFNKSIKQFQYMIDSPDRLPDVALADLHWKIAMSWLRLRPDEGGMFTLDASAIQSCQHMPEAIRELGQVLQHNPDYYWAHEVLASIYRYQGDSQMAAFHLKQAEAILKRQAQHAGN